MIPPQLNAPRWTRLKRALSYTLLNFATPLVFYAAFYEWGAKPAIGFAVAVTCLQLVFHAVKHLKPSPIFALASGFIVLFGTIDLFIDDPQYYRLEPFVQNMVVGTVLLISYFRGVPLLNRFIKALPAALHPHFIDPSSDGSYMMNVTLVWVFYLYIKGALFLYFALNFDLGTFVLIRTVFGGLTLGLMVLGEWLYRTQVKSKSPVHDPLS